MILNKKKKPDRHDKIPFLTLTLLEDRAIRKQIKREISQNQDEKKNHAPLVRIQHQNIRTRSDGF